MYILRIIALFVLTTCFVFAGGESKAQQKSPATKPDLPIGAPAIVTNGDAVQLEVDGKPFLMLGGELSNSSSSTIDYMADIWPKLTALHLNTVLTPVSWAQLEPKEGKYDFSLVDGLINAARANNLHIVVLWLASWKNGMSCYMPLWVKENYQRFPRIQRPDGTPVEVLSTLSANNCLADSSAFSALMRHLRQFDGAEHTVLMVQVENEVGVLGDTRDHSPQANAAFASQVPSDLLNALQSPSANLVPEFSSIWNAAGHKDSGTWTEVFGPGAKADEIFMAWNYARYANSVAEAGKKAYPIPMYCNCWLDNPGDQPGNYPSGCPESDMLNVWKAGAPDIDMLSPDLYASNFIERCDLFTRLKNILFVPEMPTDETGARNVFYAIGAKGALGTSPFGIDHVPVDAAIGETYSELSQISPLFLTQEQTGSAIGFSLSSDNPSTTYVMNGYQLTISLLSVFGHTFPTGAGLVVADGPNQFIGIGDGFQVAFKPLTAGPGYAGIGSVETGSLLEGVWKKDRTLNGDQTDQGWHWQMSKWTGGMTRCTVYRYD